MKELIKNCAWCFPPESKERQALGEYVTDGICAMHRERFIQQYLEQRHGKITSLYGRSQITKLHRAG